MKPYIHKVNYYETDKMGITHHSNYVRFMEEARVYFLDQIGWSFIDLENKGIMSPVINIECNFKKTTTFPDEINIEIYIENNAEDESCTIFGVRRYIYEIIYVSIAWVILMNYLFFVRMVTLINKNYFGGCHVKYFTIRKNLTNCSP